jgi:hypothetical protein
MDEKEFFAGRNEKLKSHVWKQEAPGKWNLTHKLTRLCDGKIWEATESNWIGEYYVGSQNTVKLALGAFENVVESLELRAKAH